MRTIAPGCVVESKVTLAGCAITRGDNAEVIEYEPGFGEVLLVERIDRTRLSIARGDVLHPSDCENH